MADVGGGNADHAGFETELPIDWLDPAQLGDGLPGRIGLTILPGKRGLSFRYPGRTYRRDLDEDFALLRAAGPPARSAGSRWRPPATSAPRPI